MWRVFLVEDEIVVRENIRDHVPWKKKGFELVGEAADGEMALPLIEETRPDILITDIKMPFLDGLALSRIVRKNFPWVKIILISGHDEFALARQAISISVTEYLLKPISSNDLIDALEKVGHQIEAEAREREKLADLTSCVKNGMQVMAERFLSDLSTGIVPPGEALDRARTFSLDLIGRYYMAAIITPTLAGRPEDGTAYTEYLKAEDLIIRLLQENKDVLKFSPNLTQIVLVFKGDEPAGLESHCYSVCHSLKYEVERKTACSLTISVGGARERTQGIAESFREASAATRFAYIFGDNAVIGISDAERLKLHSGGLLVPGGGEVLECLKRGERGALDAARDAFLSRLRAAGLGPFLIGYAVLDLTLSVSRFVEELGAEAGGLIAELEGLQGLLRDGDWEGLRRFLGRILEVAYDVREKRRKNKYAEIIRGAREFILENFTSPDISLNAVASHVHVSPSHFSTIFSQETGRTFIDFLTETRIDRSKEMLRTSSLRSSEIGYSVGYKDPHYFSYIFKTKTKLTPTEFRQGTES